MHGTLESAKLLPWSTPTVVEITHDQGEQIAAMRKVRDVNDDRGWMYGYLDLTNVNDAVDATLVGALIKQNTETVKQAIANEAFRKGGATPYRGREKFVTQYDEKQVAADIGRKAPVFAERDLGRKYDEQADYGEPDCCGRAEDFHNDDDDDWAEEGAADKRYAFELFSGGDDLVAMIPRIIHSASRTYDPARASWKSYLHMQARSRVKDALDLVGEGKDSPAEPDDDNPIDWPKRYGVSGVFEVADREAEALLSTGWAAGRGRDESKLRVLHLWWKDKRSSAEIAEAAGITVSAVNRHIREWLEVPALRAADELEKSYLKLCSCWKNKKSKNRTERARAQFASLLRTYMEGNVLDAGEIGAQSASPPRTYIEKEIPEVEVPFSPEAMTRDAFRESLSQVYHDRKPRFIAAIPRSTFVTYLGFRNLTEHEINKAMASANADPRFAPGGHLALRRWVVLFSPYEVLSKGPRGRVLNSDGRHLDFVPEVGHGSQSRRSDALEVYPGYEWLQSDETPRDDRIIKKGGWRRGAPCFCGPGIVRRRERAWFRPLPGAHGSATDRMR